MSRKVCLLWRACRISRKAAPRAPDPVSGEGAQRLDHAAEEAGHKPDLPGEDRVLGLLVDGVHDKEDVGKERIICITSI